MATYYTAATGNDSTGDGSSGNPWASIGHALAGSNVSFGDDIYFGEGSAIFEGANTTIAASIGGDTENGPVTILANDGESPVIDVPATTSGRVILWAGGDIDFKIDISNTNAVELPFITHNGNGTVYFTGNNIDYAGQKFILFGTSGYTSNVRWRSGCVIKNADMTYTGSGASISSTSTFSITDSCFAYSRIGAIFVPCRVTVFGCVVGPAASALAQTIILRSKYVVLRWENNSVAVGGTGSKQCVRVGSTTADNSIREWYNSNTNYITITGNRSWSYSLVWDTYTTRNDLVYLYDSDFTNYWSAWFDPAENWFADVGFDEADIADGSWIIKAEFGSPSIPTMTNGLAGFCGDSIVNGVDRDRFADGSGITVIDAADNADSIGGATIGGMIHWIHVTMQQWHPKYCFVAVGLNNICISDQPANRTNSQTANLIVGIMRIIENYGALPIWIGMSSCIGDPPDNTEVQSVNDLVLAECYSRGWYCADISILERMESTSPSDWKTVYYADLTTNVHPNATGYDLIADHALYVFHNTNPGGCVPTICLPVECHPVRCIPVRLK